MCDGYDDNNFFHFNWGWGGAHNGYFTVNALNPPGTGIGGGSGGYNAGQEVIIGIQPPATSVTYGMALYDYVSPSASTLGYGQAFDVYTNIVNNGTGTFNGDYCAAVFDAAGNFVDYVEVLSGFTLQSNYMYTDGLRSPAPACTVCCPAPIPLGSITGQQVGTGCKWPTVALIPTTRDHGGQLQHDRLEFQHDGNAERGSDAGWVGLRQPQHRERRRLDLRG
ncbi:MAG: C10 family peptidase [Flavobacteriales bacterium]|nr:C10 family peptidase [Flavobacteriales bacterium]